MKTFVKAGSVTAMYRVVSAFVSRTALLSEQLMLLPEVPDALPRMPGTDHNTFLPLHLLIGLSAAPRCLWFMLTLSCYIFH